MVYKQQLKIVPSVAAQEGKDEGDTESIAEDLWVIGRGGLVMRC